MKKATIRWAILVFCISLAAAAAMAHGDEEHVIGTVSKVTANSITVKTTAGKMVTVGVVPATTITKGKSSATLADVAVGNRVVIHAKEPTEGTLVADTVELAVPKTAAAAAKPAS